MKRIIICADGTWNIRDQIDKNARTRRPTNVTKVARAILPTATDGTAQIVYYHDGIGTSGGWLDRHTDGAFGHGMESNVRDLYRFIVYNYNSGDELYFFGFSRGAFTVRTLAGFLNAVGLIEKGDDYFVPDIYGCYESSASRDSDAWKRAFRNVTKVRPCPPIAFVGAWDTVGALGAPGLLGQVFNRSKYKYHDIGLHSSIQNAFHAVAIDERRKPFAQNMWTRPDGWTGVLEQAWFAGVHTNVGGGCAPDGLANEALHWVIEKSEGLGLEFDKDFLAHYTPCFNSILHDSMTLIYGVMGENIRRIGDHAADGEAVHKSAVDRFNLSSCEYSPGNLSAYVNRGTPRVIDTTRVVRGTPCHEL